MKSYMITLPRGVEVDVFDLPENFDDLISKSFKDYTEGTNKDYTYLDKLSYIDSCRHYLHGGLSPDRAVQRLIKETFSKQLAETGEFLGEGDFLTLEFMADCYSAGACDLYDHYTGDNHIDDEIMRVLARVAKIVMDWTWEDGKNEN